MRGPILVLDNRDSFVWNLAHALLELGAEVEVERSDAVSVAQVQERAPRALVLSPGPGRPEDAGICVEAVRALHGQLPILGVCLGHQAIAQAFGGKVVRGEPCHGTASDVDHDGGGLFAGLPQPVPACRYHSLVVDERSLPASLQVDARTDNGVVMSVRHRQHSVYGVQFHPESFCTPLGPDLLRNFVATT